MTFREVISSYKVSLLRPAPRPVSLNNVIHSQQPSPLFIQLCSIFMTTLKNLAHYSKQIQRIIGLYLHPLCLYEQ